MVLIDLRWIFREMAGVIFWPVRQLKPPNSPHTCAYCLYGMDPFDSLRGHYSLQTASDIKSNLRFEISDLLIHAHIAYMVLALFVASEATVASKQPRRSDLASDLKSMAQTTYATMFVWAV